MPTNPSDTSQSLVPAPTMTGNRVSPEMRAVIDTIPVMRQSGLGDIIRKEEEGFYTIAQPFGDEPDRPVLDPTPYDQNQGWWETFSSAWDLGLLGAAARRIKRASKDVFSERTPISVHDYFRVYWDSLEESVRQNYVKGRYDAYDTEEALSHILLNDIQIVQEQRKVATGSAWASGVANTADFIFAAAAVELATAGIATPGVFAGTFGVGVRATASAAKAGKTALSAAQAAVKAGPKATKALENIAARKGYLVTARTGTAIAVSGARVGTTRLTTEMAATIGHLGAQTSSTIAKIVTRPGFAAARGAYGFGAPTLFQESSLKLLEDDRSWGAVARDTAIASLIGAGTGLAARAIAAAPLPRLKGLKTVEDYIKKGLAPPAQVAKIGEAPTAVSEHFSFHPFRQFNAWGSKVGYQSAIKLGVGHQAARAVGNAGNILTSTITIAGLGAIGLSPWMFSSTGLMNKVKDYFTKQIKNVSEGKEFEMPFSGVSQGQVDPRQESFIAAAQQFQNDLKSIPPDELQKLAAALADGSLQKTIEASAKSERAEFHKQVSDVFVSVSEPWRETLMFAADDINILVEKYNPLPDQMRNLSGRLREQSKEVAIGSTIGEMLEASHLEVVDSAPEMAEFLGELSQRFANVLDAIDQTDLTSSADDNGIGYVGNMTVRLINNSLATLLEAKANGSLEQEQAKVQNDAGWLHTAAGESVADLAERATLDNLSGADWIGTHRNYADQEHYQEQIMLDGYTRGLSEKGSLTQEDHDVAFYNEWTNVANLMANFKDVLHENIPGQQAFQPHQAQVQQEIKQSKADRRGEVQPVQPAPSDIPEFVPADVAQQTDLPEFIPQP